MSCCITNNTEIDDLKILVTTLIAKVDSQQNSINVLNTIIVKFDESSTDLYLEIEQLKKKNNVLEKFVGSSNKDIHENISSMFSCMESTIEYAKSSNEYCDLIEKRIDELDNCTNEECMITITDSESSSERSSESPLTKKQKNSKKKHERRKIKRFEAQKLSTLLTNDMQKKISAAQEQWTKENGFDSTCFNMTFI